MEIIKNKTNEQKIRSYFEYLSELLNCLGKDKRKFVEKFSTAIYSVFSEMKKIVRTLRSYPFKLNEKNEKIELY